jgi:hypothetical protein
VGDVDAGTCITMAVATFGVRFVLGFTYAVFVGGSGYAE